MTNSSKAAAAALFMAAAIASEATYRHGRQLVDAELTATPLPETTDNDQEAT